MTELDKPRNPSGAFLGSIVAGLDLGKVSVALLILSWVFGGGVLWNQITQASTIAAENARAVTTASANVESIDRRLLGIEGGGSQSLIAVRDRQIEMDKHLAVVQAQQLEQDRRIDTIEASLRAHAAADAVVQGRPK